VRALVCDLIVWEADRSNDLVRDNNQGKDLDLDFNPINMILEKLMICLFLIFAYIIGCNMVVINWLPTRRVVLFVPSLLHRFKGLIDH
jgi:hypothetical protein